MPLFQARTTGERFNRCTEQFILFRRAQEVSSPFFKIKVGGPLVLAVAAVVVTLVQQQWDVTGLFMIVAAAILVWYAVNQLQGRSTRTYIRNARRHPLSQEDAEKELLLDFDEEGCTFRAPGSTLPGSDQEERRLFAYGDISGIFVSEDYLLLGSKTAGSVCFAKADLVQGTAEELTAFLEEKCGQKSVHYDLNTENMQALLK